MLALGERDVTNRARVVVEKYAAMHTLLPNASPSSSPSSPSKTASLVGSWVDADGSFISAFATPAEEMASLLEPFVELSRHQQDLSLLLLISTLSRFVCFAPEYDSWRREGRLSSIGATAPKMVERPSLRRVGESTTRGAASANGSHRHIGSRSSSFPVVPRAASPGKTSTGAAQTALEALSSGRWDAILERSNWLDSVRTACDKLTVSVCLLDAHVAMGCQRPVYLNKAFQHAVAKDGYSHSADEILKQFYFDDSSSSDVLTSAILRSLVASCRPSTSGGNNNGSGMNSRSHSPLSRGNSSSSSNNSSSSVYGDSNCVVGRNGLSVRLLIYHSAGESSANSCQRTPCLLALKPILDASGRCQYIALFPYILSPSLVATAAALYESSSSPASSEIAHVALTPVAAAKKNGTLKRQFRQNSHVLLMDQVVSAFPDVLLSAIPS